ncbi:DUF5050 domain-containing protein [Clostridium ganghwense]|uniref:DUF5050 domain-containing protein n=1 Tax=Clostridium ganghwense TaxID=312089 RepID=A0ABT4CPJ3_9CLOT|nr:DUF5050 domain-containing protein [Clostridium ganghwense]MCY6370970.1 DUF5050 domain-containing protein [Clostridium ganghwense]
MRRNQFNRVISLLLLIVFLVMPETALAYTTKDKKDKKIDYKVTYRNEGVPVDKEWKIKFNRELDESTIHSSNVYVEDSEGSKFYTNLHVSEDKKEITIKPISDYLQGKQYYIILKDIKSKHGKKLVKANKISFIVKNVYAGLPSEDGLIILKDTAYSIDYLAKNSRLKNELLNEHYDVYYAYTPTARKIKNIFGDIDISGKNKPKHYDKMTYIGPNGEKLIYEWNKKISEYELVEPAVYADVTVNSSAKVITVTVDSVQGIEGAEYFRVQHGNSMKKIGDRIVFASSSYVEKIEILSSNKTVLATGNLYTLNSNDRKNSLRIANSDLDGNTAGNINNNGYVTEDGDGYLYFNNTGDSGKLYKLDTNGVFNNAICNDKAQYINVFNDWVYYSNYSDGGKLYKIRKDGTGRKKISDDMAAYVTISGDWIYYSNHSDGGRLYKIRTNGTERKVVSSILKDEVAYINVCGEWIYYTNINDRHKPYVINRSGNYVSKLSDEWANSIQVKGDWVYYTSSTGVLSKVKKDGTGSIIPIQGQTREFDKGFHLNVVGKWIYYSNHQDGGKLYKISTDGSGTKYKLTNEKVDYISIVNNFIYYTSKGKLYKLPSDTNGKEKAEAIGKSKTASKIIEMDDIKVTVDYSDVNLEISELEDEYLPEKVSGIMDDNTMHQFSVIWDTEKATMRNGVRTYNGEIVGFNRKIKLELWLASEKLNETNTIRIYNNPGRNTDIIEVENVFDNNPSAKPRKLNIGDVINIYDSEDCVKSLGKATVTRIGKYNRATVQRLELDKYGQKSIWITVMRKGKAESKPTQVKQADIPSILRAEDGDDEGIGVSGKDFEIVEWVPSQVRSPEKYHVYILYGSTKLDLSKSDFDKIDEIGVRNSTTGSTWHGDEKLTKDSKRTTFRKGKYNIYVAGKFEGWASSDDRGKDPDVEGYVCSDGVTIDVDDEMLPKKPSFSKQKVKKYDDVKLNTTPARGETAWLIPVSRIGEVVNWTTLSGKPWPFTSTDIANKTVTRLEGDGATKVMNAPKGMEPNDPNYKDIEYKLVITNNVGASPVSDYTVIVDNKKPTVTLWDRVDVGDAAKLYLGEAFKATSDENSDLYIISKDIRNIDSIDLINEAVKAKIGKEFRSARTGIPKYMSTDKLEAATTNINTNYQIVAVDEVGNISEVKYVTVWIHLDILKGLIDQANGVLLTLDGDSRRKLNDAVIKAKEVHMNATNFKNVSQRDIDNAADRLKTIMIDIGVPDANATDQEIVLAEKNGLTIENMSNITEDIVLPTKGKFRNDVNITWISDKNSILSSVGSNLGKVNRPVGRDERVTLTATITKGSETAIKKLYVTVKQIEVNMNPVTVNKIDDVTSEITVTWEAPESNNIARYEVVVKEGSQPTLSNAGTVFAADKRTGTVRFTNNDAAEKSIYIAVIAVGINGSKTMCKNIQSAVIEAKEVVSVEASVPTAQVSAVEFTDGDTGVNQIGGKITWTAPADVSNVTHYVIYTSTDGSTKGTKLGEVAVGTNEYDIVVGTPSAGVTHLAVYTKNTVGESTTGVYKAITDVTP